MWLDPGELTTLLEVYRRLDPEAGSPSEAVCPRGGQKLVELTFPGSDVAVDLCPDCQGLWLDAGGLALLQRDVASIIPRNDASLSERAKELLTVAERAKNQRFSCPKCNAKLWHLERHGNIIESCSDCEGMWFDTGELTVLLGVYRRLQTDAARPSGAQCIRCDTELVELAFPETTIQVDACPDCRGLWLDRGEFDQLKANVAHLIADDGPSLSERADEILEGLDLAAQERARCPKCQGRLESCVLRSARAERCQGCKGTWLDSGDLTRVVGVSRRLRPTQDGEFTELPCIRCPDQELIELSYPGTDVAIDICPDCRGVYLDEGEIERLANAIHPVN